MTQPNLPALTSTKAKDRIRMAELLADMIRARGASCERGEFEGPREITLCVNTPRGLRVNVDLDGASSQPDVYVLSWHMGWESNDRLNDATFGGRVNPHHQQKATYIAHGFAHLYERLKFGLDKAISGDAFLPRSEAIEPAQEAIATRPRG